MRVATVDGLVTLFYDGSKELYNEDLDFERLAEVNAMRRRDGHGTERVNDLETLDVSVECKRYFRERFSWQQIIVAEGVTEIPISTFDGCINIRRVIFSNTIIRIESFAFCQCEGLVFIKWSMSLVYVGNSAFTSCNLSSVFMPATCREICDLAFEGNTNLCIFHVPQDTELGSYVIDDTAIARVFSMDRMNRHQQELNQSTSFDRISARTRGAIARRIPVTLAASSSDEMNTWIKTINNDEEFALHRACSSFHPLKEVIHAIIQAKGLKAFKKKNSAGITPSQYLKENPYTDLTENEIIHDYLMKMMGECQ